MSSRQEQKEARRQERLAEEETARKAEARRRTLGLAVGGGLALAAVAAIVVVLLAGGGDDGAKTKNTKGQTGVAIPAQQEKDLNKAAKAAGCVVQSFPKGYEDRTHVDEAVEYATNPPTYGPHAPPPNWASDGDYAGQGTPPKERLVHSLEHGRIIIQYRQGTSPRQIGQLETLYNEKALPNVIDGYNTILVENNTNMPYAVAATAWTHLLGCKTFNDKSFDAIRAFRTKYVDKAPELVQTHE